MSARQIIVLAVLAIADICVLGLGVLILMMNMPQSQTAVTPASQAAAAGE